MQFFGIGFLVLLFLEIMSVVWVADWLGGGGALFLMIVSFVGGMMMLRHTGISGLLLAGNFTVPNVVAGALCRGRAAADESRICFDSIRAAVAAAVERTADCRYGCGECGGFRPHGAVFTAGRGRRHHRGRVHRNLGQCAKPQTGIHRA